jgi:hypothetical protein
MAVSRIGWRNGSTLVVDRRLRLVSNNDVVMLVLRKLEALACRLHLDPKARPIRFGLPPAPESKSATYKRDL